MRLALPSLSRTRTLVVALVAAVVAAGAATLVLGDRAAIGAAGPAPASGVALTVLHSGKCLNVSKASTADKAPVVQYRCVGAANERWRAVPQDDGTYQLVAEHSGKCLNVSGGSAANSAPLIQYTCVGAPNEKWTPLNRADSNRFTLVSLRSGKCVNVAKASTADGAPVVQYDCVPASGAPNATWSGTPERAADAWSAGPTTALQPVRGADLHLSYVDAQGRAWYTAIDPAAGNPDAWSQLPDEQRFSGRPALLPAGTGVQVLARSTHSDVFGMLPPGRARWVDTGGNVESDPARGDGFVTAVGWDNRLYAAPDDGVHVPFMAWRQVGGFARSDYTGTPVVIATPSGRYVYTGSLDGSVRAAFYNSSTNTLETNQLVGTGSTGDISVGLYRSSAGLPRQVVATTLSGGTIAVKFQNPLLLGDWPSEWTPLPGVIPSGPPQVFVTPDNRAVVLAWDGETSTVKLATETAAGSRTFGAWQTVATPEPIATIPVPFTYQPATGPATWGFVVRDDDDDTVVVLAPTGTAPTAVRELPAPRR